MILYNAFYISLSWKVKNVPSTLTFLSLPYCESLLPNYGPNFHGSNGCSFVDCPFMINPPNKKTNKQTCCMSEGDGEKEREREGGTERERGHKKSKK